MAENNQHFNIQELADKWAQGKLTPDEQAYLETWYAQFNDEQVNLTGSRHENADNLRKAMLAQINAQIIEKPIRKLWDWKRTAVAASILIALSAGGYFILHKQAAPQIAQNQPHDIAPGHNQATLTLSNGKKIILTKGLNGQLAKQGNTVINANAGAAITYTADNTATQINYNTLSTAKGEMSPYPLILADGTKVWLNAASSITFPTAFPGKERIVSVTGEAIFEVAHNAAHPFKINVAGQTVEDIGTEFNINAYADEPTVKVTLASGKVKIVKDGREALLNPGQVGISTAHNIIIANADLDAAFAWANGLFLYDNEPLSSIMRQVARWYDVDVVFDGANPNKLFGGGISRYKNVSQVLRKLELTGGVHFSIEGRRVIARK